MGRRLRALLCLAAALRLAAAQEPRTPAEAWGATPLGSKPAGGATGHTAVGDQYVIYHRPWFHNERFYAPSGPASPRLPPRSRDAGSKAPLLSLPLRQPEQLPALVEAHWLGGLSVLIDFAFPTAASNMGSWAEVLLPLFCALSSPRWRSVTGHSAVSAVILPTYDRAELQGLNWLWDVWRVALSPTEQTAAPRFLFRDDLNAPSKRHWLCFEHLLTPHDRYTAPGVRGGFWSGQLGRSFRAAAYQLQGLALPQQPPRTITLLDGPPEAASIANGPELTAALWDTAQALGLTVRPFIATPETPLASFLGAMARTGVLVARHGSLLTNAVFLPPGAVVVELLPFHWEWAGFSSLYRNLTASVGDLHHTAWRARQPGSVAFASPDDARFSGWDTRECITAECVAVHGAAPTIADVAAVQELLHRALPAVLAGASVADAGLPWPPVQPELATSLFQWQR